MKYHRIHATIELQHNLILCYYVLRYYIYLTSSHFWNNTVSNR